ncbi:MAG: TonB-dependent receptor [Marinilabiliaceae bacterium]|nr:TonB-dependent receptor [Marinilabiliaceae bacterium]
MFKKIFSIKYLKPYFIYPFLFCTLPTAGQNNRDSTFTLQLGEVTILETFNTHREVIPSQKLSGEELQRINSHSVADAIRYFSGVQIKDYGGIGGLKTVDIRSMGSNHLGVFYDGIQLGNAQNGQIDLGKFSLDNIEEVSLYNGQKSEIFQSAKEFGSAGTIYLKTRRPIFEEDKNFNIRGIIRTGSFGLLNPSLLWEQKINKSLSSTINAEYIQATGKYKFRYRKILPDGTIAWDTTAVRQNGDIQAYRIESGIYGQSKTTSWNAKIYFYNSEKGIPGAIVNNVWKRSQRQWDNNFFTQASFLKEVNKNYSFMLNAKYANDYMRYLNPDTTLIYIDNNFTQQELYISTSNRFSILPKWDISLSGDFQLNTLDASLQTFTPPKRYTTLSAIATSFEVWRFKLLASLLGTFVQEKSKLDGFPYIYSQNTNNKEYTPAFFLSCKPFQQHHFNIRAFYKKIFRMPTFNDLYYTDIGNSALNPEYTTQYNIGLNYTKIFFNGILETITFNSDAYYNEITDKIVAIPKGNGQFRWMMMNIGYVKIHGIDSKAQLNWKFFENIHIQTNLNYTYQKAQDFSDATDNDPIAGTYGSQIAYIPWHNGSFTVRINSKSYDFNYSFIYVGERYHNSSNIRENREQPWYTSDISMGKELKFNKLQCKVSAEINNIFNQQYDVVLNYPMPGTNYKIILKFDI